MSNTPNGLIGVTVEYQEPLLLEILRALQHQPISPMQKEVAALVAQGLSNNAISQRLHIKLSTVKDYLALIFTKLNIESREKLLPRLRQIEKY